MIVARGYIPLGESSDLARRVEKSVRQPRQKSLVLILAREFASNLATPIYIADADERLVYFNEPAERTAGRSFAETGEIPVQEFTDMLAPSNANGEPIRREDTPGGIAFTERRPSHGNLCITGLDGIRRDIATTAFPLFGPDEEFHGIMVIFWEA